MITKISFQLGPVCDKLSPCENGGKCRDVCEPPGYKCKCIEPYHGEKCQLNSASTTTQQPVTG